MSGGWETHEREGEEGNGTGSAVELFLGRDILLHHPGQSTEPCCVQRKARNPTLQVAVSSTDPDSHLSYSVMIVVMGVKATNQQEKDRADGCDELAALTANSRSSGRPPGP